VEGHPLLQARHLRPAGASLPHRLHSFDLLELTSPSQDAAMTAHVDMAPTFHFYRDGAKIKEYVGSSYPALEVRLYSSCSFSGLELTLPLSRSAPWAPSSAATSRPLPSSRNSHHCIAPASPSSLSPSVTFLRLSRSVRLAVRRLQASCRRGPMRVGRNPRRRSSASLVASLPVIVCLLFGPRESVRSAKRAARASSCATSQSSPRRPGVQPASSDRRACRRSASGEASSARTPS